ncbi:MAG: hypothetical protein WAL85_08000 [Candidatus Korobacteraceae bacterium]
MRRHPVLIILAILFLGLSLGAQTTATSGGQSPATPPNTMSPPIQIAVTGCLKRGNEGGYRLKDQNGTIWQLTSTAVKLGHHLNQVIAVTGKPAPTTPQSEANPSQGGTTDTAAKPSPGLRVLTLKMLSNSCTR